MTGHRLPAGRLAASIQLMRTPLIGYLLSVIGMAAGVATGGYAGAAIADANRSGDLGDIGLGLAALGIGALLGGAAGVFVLLTVGRQPAPISTALLTLPLGVAGIVALFSMIAQIPRSPAGDVVAQVIALGTGLAVPLVARLLAMRLSQGSRSRGPTP